MYPMASQFLRYRAKREGGMEVESVKRIQAVWLLGWKIYSYHANVFEHMPALNTLTGRSHVFLGTHEVPNTSNHGTATG